MTTYSAKSANSRTEWILQDGRLKEISPDSFMFTLAGRDTLTLLKLLLQGKNEIVYAAQREKTPIADNTLRVDIDGEPLERGPRATSSIEIDEQITSGGLFKTIEPGRGA